jgi:hypothetical protein
MASESEFAFSFKSDTITRALGSGGKACGRPEEEEEEQEEDPRQWLKWPWDVLQQP